MTRRGASEEVRDGQDAVGEKLDRERDGADLVEGLVEEVGEEAVAGSLGRACRMNISERSLLVNWAEQGEARIRTGMGRGPREQRKEGRKGQGKRGKRG